MIDISNDTDRILISEETIRSTVKKLAGEIDNEYRHHSDNLLLLGILKGSFIFLSDLIREMTLSVKIDFMKVSSYGSGSVSSGNLNFQLDIAPEKIAGADVLIIEDIIDSGRTLSRLTEHLKKRGANSVKTCTLLDKPARREIEFTPDLCGIVIEDEFVVGYGLDYDERYRSLPYIAVLKPEVYSGK